MSSITRFLIPVNWTLWGTLLLALLWAFVDSIANPTYTPEVSPQVGPMVIGALLMGATLRNHSILLSEVC